MNNHICPICNKEIDEDEFIEEKGERVCTECGTELYANWLDDYDFLDEDT